MNAADLLAPAVEGFLLGASLIIAIGPQNAFVLRQGLVRAHVFAVATLCALSDAVLIAAGVGGLGTLVKSMPALAGAVAFGGALFLVVYGLIAFHRALRPGHLEAARRADSGLGAALATCLAFTFLNPHVYLDTVVLVGALSARYAGAGRLAFGIGAALASLVWFYGLGYGARLLAPLFARDAAWRVLDVAIGIVDVGDRRPSAGRGLRRIVTRP